MPHGRCMITIGIIGVCYAYTTQTWINNHAEKDNWMHIFTIFSDNHWLVMVSLLNIVDYIFHAFWNHKKSSHCSLQEEWIICSLIVPKRITEQWSALLINGKMFIRDKSIMISYSFPNWNSIALSGSVHEPPDWTVTTLGAARIIAEATGMDTILCIKCAIMVYPNKVYAIS